MSLLLDNAVVSTTRANPADNTTAPILLNVRANIGPPGPKDAAPEGGIIHYVVRLDPAADIQPQDVLTIGAWGQFAVNPARTYRVFSAAMTGTFGLEVLRCLVGDWIGR